MRTNKQFTKAFKLQIVDEYLNGNTSLQYLANKYELASSSQILNWVKQYQTYGEEYFDVEHRGRKKKETVCLDMMTKDEQIHYLKMEVAVLKKQLP